MKQTKLKVEVKHGPTRVIARLFKETEQATRFFEATCNAHQQRANREGISFSVTLQVVEESPARVVSLLEERHLDPLSH